MTDKRIPLNQLKKLYDSIKLELTGYAEVYTDETDNVINPEYLKVELKRAYNKIIRDEDLYKHFKETPDFDKWEGGWFRKYIREHSTIYVDYDIDKE